MEHAWVLAVLTDIQKHAEKNRLVDLFDALEPALKAAATLNRAADVTQFCERVGRPAPATHEMLNLVKKARRDE